MKHNVRFGVLTVVTLIFFFSPAMAGELRFLKGTATPSAVCGKCHRSIYREYAFGFGSDLQYKPTTSPTDPGKKLLMPANVSTHSTAHAFAGAEPYPIHAREAEEKGKSCNTCHFPEPFTIPNIHTPKLGKPKGRGKKTETMGLTCASCHLTEDGKIRGPFKVHAPHATVVEPAIRSSAMCAYCHSKGKRVPGKQTQTFFEWRDDFYRPGLGKQQCQDCHMPRTMRKVSEKADDVRPVARHLWTGGYSKRRLQSALSLVVVQPRKGRPALRYHVINIGAGHSVPTGSNRRAIYLQTKILNKAGKILVSKSWMFAPWFGNRPDDRKFLEQDKKNPNAVALMQADAQGPHEAIVRAGEERVLAWRPSLREGIYTVKTRLVYDRNRYNKCSYTGDQTVISSSSMVIIVSQKK